MDRPEGRSLAARGQLIVTALAGLFTLMLYAVVWILPIESAWGINQFLFLKPVWLILPALSFAAIIIIAVSTGSFGRVTSWLESLSTLIWERGFLPRIALALLTVLFYIFRTPQFFTGDGYHLLNSFGGLSNFHTGSTKYGSVLIVKGVQGILGTSTYESAQIAFQICSIVCGGLVILLLIAIAGEITKNRLLRLLSLTVLLFSGAMLIFFGHVEFYPMVWVVSCLWFFLALRELNSGSSLLLYAAVFAAMVFCHIQSLCFLPALLYLVWLRLRGQKENASGTLVLIPALALPLLAVIGGFLATSVNDRLTSYLLPLTASNNSFSSYAVFSWHHLSEILNLSMALYPGMVVLVILAVSTGRWDRRDKHIHFFLLAASGGLSFILVVNPALGMARDLDLMSLMLLPAILLLLLLVTRSRLQVSPGAILIVSLVCITGSTTFLATNLSGDVAEKRIFSLLQHYGNRDRGGWQSYVAYLENDGSAERHRQAVLSMKEVFPGQAALSEIDALVESDSLDEAWRIARELTAKYPDDGVYHRTLADILTHQGKYAEAHICYERAVNLRPDHVTFYGFGVLHQHIGDHDEAICMLERARQLAPRATRAIEALAASCLHTGDMRRAGKLADTLFEMHPGAPGGHVIKMLTALADGQLVVARQHYYSFKECGRGRPDYDEIIAAYASVFP
ncbi:MAG: tetratricopeptide repeat protein [Candidatus Zixiibacteriota bacterium]|nr:MAG: tetratricopeptide repeat protein [candidate division Zixibacteria bacterium]